MRSFLLTSVFFLFIIRHVFSQDFESYYNAIDFNLPTDTYTDCVGPLSHPNFKVPGKITTTFSNSTSTVLSPRYSKMTAGEYIQLNPGILIYPSSCTYPNTQFSQFNIAPGNCDVVITNSLNGSIGLHEMLELGIKPSQSIADAIHNFFFNSSGTKVNPYNADHNDPDFIDIVADFVSPTGIHKTAYGFFYRDYSVDQTNDTWIENPTNYPFRVRFAPDEYGSWNVSINIYSSAENLLNLTIDPTCSASGFNGAYSENLGYLEVGLHNNLRYHDNHQSFFALGQNNAWPIGDFGGYLTEIVHPSDFNKQIHNLISLSDNHGNYNRICMLPLSQGIEWEHLGVYDSYVSGVYDSYTPPVQFGDQSLRNRQEQAWEFDRLLKAAEQKHVYIQLDIEKSDQYNVVHHEWDEDHRQCWESNPYHSIVSEPYEFFSNATTLKLFKRKLRYLIARWGYSTSIASYELMSEVDRIDNHGDHLNEINGWLIYIKNYIKNNLDSKHLISWSWATIEASENYFMHSQPDFSDVHNYGDKKNQNYDWRYHYSESGTTLYNIKKPFILGEMGGAQLTEACSDLSFHNALWSTAFMGGFGSGLEWWEWDNDAYRTNFNGISNFFSGIDFESHHFERTQWRNSDPFEFDITNCSGSWNWLTTKRYYTLENYELVSTSGKLAMGWLHNATAYWHNTTCWSSSPEPCDADDYGHILPIGSHQKFKIKGLDVWRQYHLDLYRPEDNSWYYYYDESTNILGELRLKCWDMFNWSNDYVYKAHRSGYSWRPTNDSIPPDTLDCPLDTNFVNVTYDDDSLHLFTYEWNFGNGQTYIGNNPKVYFSTPGTYTVTLIVSDSMGWADTLQQQFIVPYCDSIAARMQNSFAENHSTDSLPFKVYPNPAHDKLSIEFLDEISLPIAIRIFNSLDQLVFLKENVKEIKTDFNTSHLEPGMYFVKIVGINNSSFAKFIVQ
jgi:hypothetical protein